MLVTTAPPAVALCSEPDDFPPVGNKDVGEVDDDEEPVDVDDEEEPVDTEELEVDEEEPVGVDDDEEPVGVDDEEEPVGVDDRRDAAVTAAGWNDSARTTTSPAITAKATRSDLRARYTGVERGRFWSEEFVGGISGGGCQLRSGTP